MKITPHLDDRELACHDGTPYPREWIDSRARPLAETFEVIRAEAGGTPMAVLSAYRPPAYNRGKGGARESQHMAGRALDVKHGKLSAAKLHALILRLYSDGKLPYLGGLGRYNSFVHFDVRPRKNGRLARWRGKRVAAELG